VRERERERERERRVRSSKIRRRMKGKCNSSAINVVAEQREVPYSRGLSSSFLYVTCAEGEKDSVPFLTTISDKVFN
jgi:hypothetical protein